MKSIALFISLLIFPVLVPVLVLAEAVPGKPAPPFSAVDSTGKTRSLGDFHGKWLVLEWFNKDCPFVHKQYDSGNMQRLQKAYTDRGVAWMQVVSSAKGKQGYLTPAEADAVIKQKGSHATALLLDPTGAVGKAYGAKTTPHMFIINPEGNVVYAGAIDDNDSSDPAVIKTSHNYVSAALDSGLAGKAVTVSSTRSYGCSVKYQ